MPKRNSKQKRKKQSEDVNQIAHRLVKQSTERPIKEPEAPLTQSQISQFMSQMGKKGGKIGGKRRMEKMTAEERSAVALKGARARWGSATKEV